MLQHSPGIFHPHVRHLDFDLPGPDHRRGTIFDRVRNILMPIHTVAGGYKYITRAHLA